MKTNQIPRKLGHSVKVNGFIYKQVIRSSHYAIYAQLYNHECEPRRYEVIKIQIKGGKRFKDKYIPLYEAYPQTSLWGSQAWTVGSIEVALAKYNYLVEKEASTLFPNLPKEPTV
ncbi:hypothetical protein OKW21_005819 [Catalinimonas alkaloidigena]|uniref:hypothetical protein n=1 Tax=Catalinimonas alkaloidigena TaxID=1075417 RepID=UPI0024060A9D|nr:hypothetical protein [Catalinimonas alkaloidigena]MDF9800556.1 hypothetical protein [Catalinimonas alkaloidigena]